MERDRERVQKVVGREGVLVPHLDVDDARWRIQHTTDPSRQKTITESGGNAHASTHTPKCNATNRSVHVQAEFLVPHGVLMVGRKDTRKEHVCSAVV